MLLCNTGDHTDFNPNLSTKLKLDLENCSQIILLQSPDTSFFFTKISTASSASSGFINRWSLLSCHAVTNQSKLCPDTSYSIHHVILMFFEVTVKRKISSLYIFILLLLALNSIKCLVILNLTVLYHISICQATFSAQTPLIKH